MVLQEKISVAVSNIIRSHHEADGQAARLEWVGDGQGHPTAPACYRRYGAVDVVLLIVHVPLCWRRMPRPSWNIEKHRGGSLSF